MISSLMSAVDAFDVCKKRVALAITRRVDDDSWRPHNPRITTSARLPNCTRVARRRTFKGAAALLIESQALLLAIASDAFSIATDRRTRAAVHVALAARALPLAFQE